MRKIQTSANYAPPKGEINTSPSETIPDQAMSLKTLLERHTRGMPLPNNQMNLFDEDYDLPDMKTLDLVDQDEIMRFNREKIEGLKKTQTYLENESKKRKAQPEKITPPPGE